MAMAGCGAYSKIEGFAFLPITSFTMALTTFVGQNIGAKEYARVRRGARFGIICSMTIAELIGLVTFVWAPQLIAAFNDKPEVTPTAPTALSNRAFFFLPARVLALHIVRAPRRRKIDGADARHACLLVCDPRDHSFRFRSDDGLDRRCILGLSDHMVPQLDRISDLLLHRRLDPQLRPCKIKSEHTKSSRPMWRELLRGEAYQGLIGAVIAVGNYAGQFQQTAYLYYR